MTPKEKAQDLVLKYSILKDGHNDLVKQCALIAVDEIINCDTYFNTLLDVKVFTEYWYNVQQEIKKL